MNLFNGDLNEHVEATKAGAKSSCTVLQLAAIGGQTECIEVLLEAKADPHMKQCMPYGTDPEYGCTALDFAKKYGWDDCMELLETAAKSQPYGYYLPAGKRNNAKCYNCFPSACSSRARARSTSR